MAHAKFHAASNIHQPPMQGRPVFETASPATRASQTCVSDSFTCALQVASSNVAYSDALSQQNQALQSAQSSLPALPPQLAGTLSGIISGLNSGVSQAAAVSFRSLLHHTAL